MSHILTDDQYAVLIKKAEAFNREMDEVEKQAGYGRPNQCPPDIWVRTIDTAIEAGIKTQDWDCVAQGLVMLRDYLATLPRTLSRKLN